MRSVGVREFRDHATKLIGSGETLVIEKHGEPVGFFVPIVAKDRRAGAQALERLDVLVTEVLEERDLTEDELVSEVVGAGDGRDWRIQLHSARVSNDPLEGVVYSTARWVPQPDEARR